MPGLVPLWRTSEQGCRFQTRCIYKLERCIHQMPLLQTLGEREVRCHLYPEQTILPSMQIQSTPWPSEPIEPHLLIAMRDVHIAFKIGHIFSKHKGCIQAVQGISLDIKKGKTLALVGESGCGKTTLARAVVRLQAIQSGSIQYRNQNIMQLKGKALRDYRKQVQIIFQDPYSSMNPRLTIADILAEGMMAQNMSATVIKKIQKRLLDQVQLPQDSLQRYPHQFSGGQRQRICIARALALEPEILVCDEPTSALDVSVQAQILNLLKELQVELGLGLLFITHNMGVVAYLADEVAVMKKGQIIEQGLTEKILKNPEQAYTKELLASVMTIE